MRPEGCLVLLAALIDGESLAGEFAVTGLGDLKDHT
jgi:hypothetical protein